MKSLFFTFLFLCSVVTIAQQSLKTESPYLILSNPKAQVPLLKSNADINIVGTVAHVSLSQTYHNEGTVPVEASYVFPMSLQAAVHDMTMTIGDRVVVAKIFEKQKAEKIYQDAIKQGKRAAKLDQSRPNVFKMKVGNIMPGDYITLKVFYTEMVTPTAGEYQLIVPGVVGPRFTGEDTSGDNTFKQPYTKKGISATFDYDVTATLQAGVIIQNISSTSHALDIQYPTAQQAVISLSETNEDPANRDFLLRYSLRGNHINTGLLLYEHKDEKFFAYMMEPPARPSAHSVTPREYIFIVDVSGSMNGYPLEVSKQLMRNLLCNLNPEDTFNVQLFASSSTMYSSQSVLANEQNIEDAILFLNRGQGGGGTQLLSALKNAYNLPRSDEGSSRSMVVITDGYVSVEKETFTIIEKNLHKANVFTFGIGSSVNRYLIDGMAKVSNTASFVATDFSEAQNLANTFKTYIETPLLTQVSFQTKGFEVYDLANAQVPDVFADRPVLILGKYKGDPKGKIIIKGYQGRKKITHTYDVTTGINSKNNSALRYLWARKRIEKLDDYNSNFGEDVKQEVTQLGLSYNLMTKYTSFVAVDEKVANKGGALKKVKQPLPLPQNVNNSAVGAEASIKEKSAFKKSFSMLIDKSLPKAEAIRLQMWFKVHFTKLVTPYLETYEKLRFKFGTNSKLLKVEVFLNGKWEEIPEVSKTFKTLSQRSAGSKTQFTIIASLK